MSQPQHMLHGAARAADPCREHKKPLRRVDGYSGVGARTTAGDARYTLPRQKRRGVKRVLHRYDGYDVQDCVFCTRTSNPSAVSSTI